jgi:hypothetical protein
MTHERMAMVSLTAWLAITANTAALGHEHAPPVAPAATQSAELARADISITSVDEDHQRLLRATVTFQGKPLENITVAFHVRRTFGNMVLGQDQTLDDGTAAVPFPLDLPGGQRGELHIIAEITASPQYSGHAEAVVEGGAIVPPDPNPFPRALWAPRAPWALITAIIVLLAGVWGAFAYVVVQLHRIRKEAFNEQIGTIRDGP